jgi:hypothetical protein
MANCAAKFRKSIVDLIVLVNGPTQPNMPLESMFLDD